MSRRILAAVLLSGVVIAWWRVAVRFADSSSQPHAHRPVHHLTAAQEYPNAPTTEWDAPVSPDPDPASVPDASRRRQAYLSVMRKDPYWSGQPDRYLIAEGHVVCKMFKLAHGSVLTVLNGEISAGIPGGSAGKIIGAAVPMFCPQYKADLQ